MPVPPPATWVTPKPLIILVPLTVRTLSQPDPIFRAVSVPAPPVMAEIFKAFKDPAPTPEEEIFNPLAVPPVVIWLEVVTFKPLAVKVPEVWVRAGNDTSKPV